MDGGRVRRDGGSLDRCTKLRPDRLQAVLQLLGFRVFHRARWTSPGEDTSRVQRWTRVAVDSSTARFMGVPLMPPFRIAVLPSLSRLMKDGVGEGFTRADHAALASQLESTPATAPAPSRSPVSSPAVADTIQYCRSWLHGYKSP